MPTQQFGKRSEAIDAALNRILNARYKLYRNSRDKGETPVVTDGFEAVTFSMTYDAEKLGETIRALVGVKDPES